MKFIFDHVFEGWRCLLKDCLHIFHLSVFYSYFSGSLLSRSLSSHNAYPFLPSSNPRSPPRHPVSCCPVAGDVWWRGLCSQQLTVLSWWWLPWSAVFATVCLLRQPPTFEGDRSRSGVLSFSDPVLPSGVRFLVDTYIYIIFYATGRSSRL